jgi:flagellar biosynthesis protein FlhB
MFRVAHVMLLQAGGVMLVWSAIDYMVEWRSFERRLRMSKQEIRQEMKDSEGSPMVRRRIRSLQRQMRRKRLQADMARACVVVTNPTHYAVALEFSFETMQAPKVLAKGMNLLAERIKEEARWAGVPVVPNPPLARSLYKSVEEGQSVPVELYTVVAEILAYLYREELERRARAQNAARAQYASTAAPMAATGPQQETQQEER